MFASLLGKLIRSAPRGNNHHVLLKRLRRLYRPAWLGTVRRTSPLSDTWGYDRGTPVDRYYIEHFLHEQRNDIRGRVLEVQDSSYTNRFGIGVTRRDVLDIAPSNPHATIISDLTHADAIAANTFDCFILNQTLHLIYDLQAALYHTHRILRPGGVVLATIPAVSRVSRGVGTEGDYWRLLVASAQTLFAGAFGPEQVTVRSYGNVLTAMAFLTGMAYEELAPHELDTHDAFFPVIIAVRAVKAQS